MKTPNHHRRFGIYFATLIIAGLRMPALLHAQLQVIHSGNLLVNPAAETRAISPWVGPGTWAVHTGPLSLPGGNTLNSCSSTRWFLSQANITQGPCSSCTGNAFVSLTQTISLSSYASVIQSNSPTLTYGGDAFAAVTAISGTCPSNNPFCHRASFEAEFKIEFLNNANGVIGSNISGPIFNSQFGCPFPAFPGKKCAFRKSVTAIPAGTVSIRFTATMHDVLSVCSGPSTTSTLANGFDNLFAEITYTQNNNSHHTDKTKKH